MSPPVLDRKKVLILCTANSARSQMAEGLLRHDAEERYDVSSAGTHTSAVRPEAITVMKEAGIDITGQRSKSVDELLNREFDFIITVCDNARNNCPVFPGPAQRIHWDIEDPATVTVENAEERLTAFRQTRDELRSRLRAFADKWK
jgi:arsenate reductase